MFFNANLEKLVNMPNDTLFNIFSKFVSSKVITVDDKDPPWILNGKQNLTTRKRGEK